MEITVGNQWLTDQISYSDCCSKMYFVVVVDHFCKTDLVCLEESLLLADLQQFVLFIWKYAFWGKKGVEVASNPKNKLFACSIAIFQTSVFFVDGSNV